MDPRTGATYRVRRRWLPWRLRIRAESVQTEAVPDAAPQTIPGLDLLNSASLESRRSAADILVAIAAVLRQGTSLPTPRTAERRGDAAETRVQPTSTP